MNEYLRKDRIERIERDRGRRSALAITWFILLVITVVWHWWVGHPMIELPLRILFVSAGVLLVQWIWRGTIRF